MRHWADGNDDIAPCGTTACIGGWAVLLAGNPLTIRRRAIHLRLRSYPHDDMARLLGLQIVKDDFDDHRLFDASNASRLFYLENWPNKFRTAYNQHFRRRHYGRAAQVAARRIEHFIKTKGKD